jgi:hypothetical protein
MDHEAITAWDVIHRSYVRQSSLRIRGLVAVNIQLEDRSVES